MKITTDYQEIVYEKTVLNCWIDDFVYLYNVETSIEDYNNDFEEEVKQFIKCNHDVAKENVYIQR